MQSRKGSERRSFDRTDFRASRAHEPSNSRNGSRNDKLACHRRRPLRRRSLYVSQAQIAHRCNARRMLSGQRRFAIAKAAYRGGGGKRSIVGRNTRDDTIDELRSRVALAAHAADRHVATTLKCVCAGSTRRRRHHRLAHRQAAARAGRRRLKIAFAAVA